MRAFLMVGMLISGHLSFFLCLFYTRMTKEYIYGGKNANVIKQII